MIKIILGDRQSGKTTMCKKYVSDKPNAIMIRSKESREKLRNKYNQFRSFTIADIKNQKHRGIKADIVVIDDFDIILKQILFENNIIAKDIIIYGNVDDIENKESFKEFLKR